MRPVSAVVLALAVTLGACDEQAPVVEAEQRVVLKDLAGNEHEPAVVEGAKAHVVFFVTNDCPIANAYAPEIQSIAADFGPKGVRCFLVHVDPDLTTEQARKHAKEFRYGNLPVLLDSKHELVRVTKATITPEAALLTPGGKMPYRGRIDDQYPELGQKRPQPRTRDLRDALTAVLAGKPVAVARTKPVGCFIPD